ncbi:MAG: hypothetical protein LBK29_00855 [Oscillospiraceae bacterium]|nr:hypothetical protein [Oscillospiraceae bacterium]
MENKFDEFLNKLKLILGNNNFSWELSSESEVFFAKENLKYVVKFENDTVKLIFLEKTLCEWLLSESKKDIEAAILDFSELILSKKNSAVRVPEKSDLKNVDFFIFAEKMCRLFPEIKEEFDNEKHKFGKNFRKIKFSSEFISPKILEILDKGKEKNKLEKIFKVLSSAYVFGDEDTKCIVTMAVLREIKTAENSVKKVLPGIFRKIWGASARYFS